MTGIDTAGNVDRQHPRTRLVDRIDRGGCQAIERPRQAGAVHRIDDQRIGAELGVGSFPRGEIGNLDQRPAEAHPRIGHRARIAFQRGVARADQQHLARHTQARQMPCCHEAIATVVALFHDLIVVVGLYSLFNFPVTPATVIALLTMLGFSIYDGIVVFDRVDENTGLASGTKPKMTYSEMANLSLNQVLMRSLNTSITTLLPIVSVLLVGSVALGASTLEEYGIALFLGLLSGAYSSLFIATPLLALLKEREPRFREGRETVLARRSGATDGPADLADNPVAPGSAPRPRKKSSR